MSGGGGPGALCRAPALLQFRARGAAASSDAGLHPGPAASLWGGGRRREGTRPNLNGTPGRLKAPAKPGTGPAETGLREGFSGPWQGKQHRTSKKPLVRLAFYSHFIFPTALKPALWLPSLDSRGNMGLERDEMLFCPEQVTARIASQV